MIPADASFPENIQLAIFDLDATLVRPVKGNPKNPAFRANESDWQLLPGRVQAMRDLREKHIEIGIATNQGGVAFRYHDPAKMAAEIWQAASMLGIYYVEFCFCHDNGSRTRFRHDCAYRKPGAGMLNILRSKAHVAPQETLYVGDRDEDFQAAQLAGVRFVTTAEFFAPYAHMSDVALNTVIPATANDAGWESAKAMYLAAPSGLQMTYSCPGCGDEVIVARPLIPLLIPFNGLCFDCVDPLIRAAHPLGAQ